MVFAVLEADFGFFQLSEIIGVIVLTSVWQTLIYSECPANCVTCTQDSGDSGTTCTSCVPGKYSGRYKDISDWPYYDDCSRDCSDDCVSCASYRNCTECVNGRYGTQCQYNCYSGCEGGVCDKLDGKCSCKTGYASRFCNGQLSCPNNPCACCKNNKCETNNSNYCSDGCIDNVRGDTCDIDCPANCETCTQDSVAGGLPCTSCVPGKYSGRKLDNSDWSYFDDCRYDCRDDCVSCASYTNCTECVNGRYGTDCQYNCYSGCEGGQCDKLDGKCTCKPGDESRVCKLCTNTHCKNNICDTNNNNFCTYGCVKERWGNKCDNICPPDCVTCTQDSVDSGLPCTSCIPGKYSGREDDDSSEAYYDDCRQDCDGCVSCTSYYNCTECIDGKYGSDCSSNCSPGCEGGKCSKTDGSCPSDKTFIYLAVGTVIALIITVLIVMSWACGLNVKLTSWIRRKCHRRRPIPVTKDNSVENDEIEQDTRRESVEMALLNENRDTIPVTHNIQNESKQESNEDPAKITIQIDNAENYSHPENVQLRQPVPQLQSIQGDNDWTFIGEQIHYDLNKLIGTGSMSVVYEGRYGSEKYKKIAVKKIMCANNVEATSRCKEIAVITRLIEPSRDPHIVDFIHSYTNVNTVYIAFELGKGTLVDYVKDSNEEWRVRLGCSNVNRGLSEGLNYIHSKGIVHRDLKPQNIFIVERNVADLKAVIGDFGSAKATAGSMYSLTGRMGSVGYIAPEIWTAMCQDPTAVLGKLCNRKSDIFSLGLILYYTISLGDNAFGHDITAQSTIEKGEKPTIGKLNQIRNSYAYQSLLECLLKAKPEERPRSDAVVLHPANWSDIQTIRYLAIKSDEIETMIKTDPSNDNILEDPLLIPNGNWMNRLPVGTKSYLKQYRVNKRSPPLYSGKETNVRYLLRVIRNTNSHWKEYPQNVQVELGDYPEGHVDMWLRVCPKLLMHVVEKLGLP